MIKDYKMKIHDISLEISEDMAVYKDNPNKKPVITITRTIKDGSNESKISLESHTGTHADAPYHMIQSGKRIDELALNSFIGKCIVLDFTKIKKTEDSIKESDLKNKKIKKNDIVLLKTKTKIENKFDYNYVYLGKSGASYLASKKIKAVGIDSLGIERSQTEHDTHKILFESNISIVEGLNLTKIKQGRYFFIGLPLKIKNGDASPIRAVLLDNIS